MRILVIGASGLVGSHLLRAARLAGHSAWGTFHRFQCPGLVPCDCSKQSDVVALVQNHRPEAIIYAAGWTWVDGCEDDPARSLAENALQPQQVARLCQAEHIHFTLLSSSYVFDGLQGPYGEDDAPNPINVYGRTKWEGEQRVQEACAGAALIARLVWVYGGEAQGKNFGYQVWKAMQSGSTLSLPSDQQGNPTFAGDLGQWLVPLAAQRQSGLCHLAGARPDCTRVEWGGMLANAFQKLGINAHPQFRIKPVSTESLGQRARRPLRAGLVSQRAEAAGWRPTAFEETVREMLANSSGVLVAG